MGGVQSAFSCAGACWRTEISVFRLLPPGNYSRQIQRLAATTAYYLFHFRRASMLK